jgi:hypothetical protein
MPSGQKRAVVMFYVAAARKFYFESDIRSGALEHCEMDEASYKSPEEIFEAAQRIFRVNQTYAEVYNSSLGDGEGESGDPGEYFEAFEDMLKRQVASTQTNAEMSGKDGADARDGNKAKTYDSPVDGWEDGVGALPADLYLKVGLNYAFHGPAGVVNRAIITAVGESRGMDLSGADVWAKQKWIAAAEELSISAEKTYAPLTVVGRTWKVCWIDGNEEKGLPAVLVWSPDDGRYFSLRAIKCKGTIGKAMALDSILRAIVGVAKSQPPPVGLKEALARDEGFLELIGRAPSSQASTSASASASTSTSTSASARTRVQDSFDDSEEGTVYVEVPDEDDEDDDEDGEGDGDDLEEDISVDASGYVLDIDDEIPEDYAAPSAWKDTMGYERASASSSKFELDPMYPPGMEPPIMDDLIPSSLDDIGPSVAGGDFGYPHSRSAGFLSFVEEKFNDEDLMHELGIDREDMYRGPKDFPDLSQPGATPTPRDATTISLRELMPKGLPKPESSYQSFYLDGLDFLVTKTNDGRLDLCEVFSARRDSYGRFVEEAQRVNTAAFMKIPPAYYQDIAWTELIVTNQEDFDSGDTIPSFNTTIEKTKKIYLVFSQNEESSSTMFDRKLDFTKPVIVFSDTNEMSLVSVRGATSDPSASLIIKDGELYCQHESETQTYEQIITEHLANVEIDGPVATAEFLIETDTEIEARANEEEDDTPMVDNF